LEAQIQPLTIHFSRKLIFGEGKLAQLPAELQSFPHQKILIVTIEPLLHQLQSLIETLEGSGSTVMIDTSIRQEPGFSHFEALMQTAAPFNPDIVIGIGGGSVLDVAKLVAAQLENPQSIDEYTGIGLLKGRNKGLICIPATSGTGSEASPNAILVDERDGQKKGIISPFLVPDLVILDPALTLSVPPGITAATGIDALTHCLEAYTNRFAHPMIDLYAYEGMKLISSNLVAAVRHGRDMKARTAVALGSYYGGVCLGPVNTAAVHALSYPLGSMYHLPHGLSNALLLPFVMEFNMIGNEAKFADVAVALGCEKRGDEKETASEGVKCIRQLISDCGLPSKLSEVGVKEDSIEQMANEALKIQRLLKNNPRELNHADAVHIFREAY